MMWMQLIGASVDGARLIFLQKGDRPRLINNNNTRRSRKRRKRGDQDKAFVLGLNKNRSSNNKNTRYLKIYIKDDIVESYLK